MTKLHLVEAASPLQATDEAWYIKLSRPRSDRAPHECYVAGPFTVEAQADEFFDRVALCAVKNEFLSRFETIEVVRVVGDAEALPQGVIDVSYLLPDGTLAAIDTAS